MEYAAVVEVTSQRVIWIVWYLIEQTTSHFNAEEWGENNSTGKWELKQNLI